MMDMVWDDLPESVLQLPFLASGELGVGTPVLALLSKMKFLLCRGQLT